MFFSDNWSRWSILEVGNMLFGFVLFLSYSGFQTKYLFGKETRVSKFVVVQPDCSVRKQLKLLNSHMLNLQV